MMTGNLCTIIHDDHYDNIVNNGDDDGDGYFVLPDVPEMQSFINFRRNCTAWVVLSNDVRFLCCSGGQGWNQLSAPSPFLCRQAGSAWTRCTEVKVTQPRQPWPPRPPRRQHSIAVAVSCSPPHARPGVSLPLSPRTQVSVVLCSTPSK